MSISILLPVLILVIAVLAAALWLFHLSYILGLVFILLVIASVLSICFARPVIRVKIKARSASSFRRVKGLKPVHAEIDTSADHSVIIRFSDFMEQNELTFTDADGNQKTYTRRTGISIRVQQKRNFFGYGCDILSNNPKEKLSEYLQFYASIVLWDNKLIVSMLTLGIILMTVSICVHFNAQYNATNALAQEYLNSNIAAIASGSQPELFTPYVNTTGEQVYYKELPEVHLVVITKEANQFLDTESVFNNPETVNTVLMLYEDNRSGGLYTEEEELTTEPTETEEIPVTYYDLTELYMNIPIFLEDRSIHTMGELFQGTVSYQSETGYPAVGAWFRDMYHIRIASVTEIPETVFAGCFGTENAVSVNLNQDFARFLYQNYCNPEAGIYTCHAAKAMLAEHQPVFSPVFLGHMEELAIRLGVRSETTSVRNAMLFLDGASMASFGNSLRSIGEDDEYTVLREKQYYQDAALFPPVEWGDTHLTNILHSNWDILLADLLDSLSNLNNGTYQVLCEGMHTESLSKIRTSMSTEEMQSFLYRLCTANDVLDNNYAPEEQFIFYVRNLDMHLSSTLGQPNAYLRQEPLNLRPYTNRQVKKSLYYCLREEKESAIT